MSPTNTLIPTRRPARPGFTVAELCVGLTITALVLSALAAFMLATGKAWADAGDGRQQTIIGWQGAQRLVQTVQQCGLVPSILSGSLTSLQTTPAGAIIWQSDANGDGLVEFGELEMLYADQAADGSWTLNLYTPPSSSFVLNTVWSYSVLENPASMAILKPMMTATPLVRGLSGVRISQPTATAGQRPLLEFALAIPSAGGGGSQIVYISAAIRAPLDAPTN